MHDTRVVVYSFDPSTREITNLNNEVLLLDGDCSYTIPQYVEDRAGEGAHLVDVRAGNCFVFSDGKTEILAQQVEHYAHAAWMDSDYEPNGEIEDRQKGEPSSPSGQLFNYSVILQLQQAPRTLSVKQVADIFSVSEKAIYKLTNRPAPSGMPCVRVGASIKFDPLTLMWWLKKQDVRFDLAAKAHAKESN